MARPVTFSPAPDTVLPAELNTIQDDYENLYQHPIDLQNASTRYVNQDSNGARWLIGGDSSASVSLSQQIAIIRDPSVIFHWDPTEYTAMAAGRNMTWRLRTYLQNPGSANPMTSIVTDVLRAGLTPGGNVFSTATDGSVQAGWPQATANLLRTTHSSIGAASFTVQSAERNDAASLPAGTYGIVYTINSPNAATGDTFFFAELSLRFTNP